MFGNYWGMLEKTDESLLVVVEESTRRPSPVLLRDRVDSVFSAWG